MKGEFASTFLNLPLLTCGFFPSGELVTGGGGGSTKSGIPNALVVLDVDDSDDVALYNRATYEFPPFEDACQSIGVHPKENVIVCSVNHSQNPSDPSQEKNCRVLRLDSEKEKRLVYVNDHKTLRDFDDDNYERVLRFSNDAKFIAAIDSKGSIDLWKWPALEKIEHKVSSIDGVLDVDFSEESKYLALVSSDTCYILELVSGERYWTIGRNSIVKSSSGGMRFVRFGSGPTSGNLFLLLSGSKTALTSLVKVDYVNKSVSSIKNIELSGATSFGISQCGKYLGISLTNMRVLVLSSSDMKIIEKVTVPKWLAITSIAFSPKNSVMACCSAAGYVMAMDYKKRGNTGYLSKQALLSILSILAIIVSIYFGIYR